MADQHLAPVCPHCGRQNGDSICCWVNNGVHARDREDYPTEECAAAEERADRVYQWSEQWRLACGRAHDDLAKWRRRARKWKRIARKNDGCTGDNKFGVPCAGELAYQAERKRVRKWKRRAEEARTERDEERQKVRAIRASQENWTEYHAQSKAQMAEDEIKIKELEEWKAEWCQSRAEQVSRLVVEKQAAERERDEARAARDAAEAVSRLACRDSGDWAAEVERLKARIENERTASQLVIGGLRESLAALRARARGMREALQRQADFAECHSVQDMAIAAAGEPIP